MTGFAIPWVGGVVVGMLIGTGNYVAAFGSAIAVVFLDYLFVKRRPTVSGM